MQLIIEHPGLKIENGLLELIQSKFEHLEKMFGRISRCRVFLKKENDECKNNYRVEANISLPGKVLFAGEQQDNFEGSLYKVLDGLNHQLHRYKTEREEIW